MKQMLDEYRRKARECENLEQRVEDEAIRQTYGELAAHWRRLVAREERLDDDERKSKRQ